MNGWVGVDLDGTLAEYHGWAGVERIGPPVPAMLARVKAWRAEGREVRIFTARVSSFSSSSEREAAEIAAARRAIEAWCLKHVGEVLPVTNVKDFAMICLWDDRAVTVEMNTGRVIMHPDGEATP